MTRDYDNREVLLVSADFVKGVSNISDNTAGKYLLPSIREAQDVKLQGILGHDLYLALKTKVKYTQLWGSFNLDYNADFDLTAGPNLYYRQLLNECQYFLAYSAITELIYKVSYKVANMGLVKSADAGMQPPTKAEIDNQRAYYQSKADACAYDLQAWVYEYRSHFPELNESDCRRIQSNLYSAATCGIFLGGARGKRLPR